MKLSGRRTLAAATLVVVAGLPGVVGAQTAQADAIKFGAREAVQQISLSPAGNRIAAVVPRSQGGESILVYDLAKPGPPVAVTGSQGKGERVTWCQWATNDRLVCSLHFIVGDAGGLSSYSRLIAFDADGGAVRMVTPRESSQAVMQAYFGGGIVDLTAPGGDPDTILITRQFVPEMTTGTINARARDGIGVIAINTRNGRSQIVEQPKTSAADYISDGHGNVRVMGIQPSTNSGYARSRVTYSFRKADDREWLPLGQVEITPGGSVGFEPVAVDGALNIVYGFDSVNGYTALFRRPLVDGGKPELVLARNGIDVDGLITIGRHKRVVGASYASERRAVEFFDPALRRLGANLARTLPAEPQITFVDASSDEKKMLLLAGSDTNPGMFYLLDSVTHKLAEVMPVRPELAGLTLSEMKPVTFPAGDGTLIPAYLTIPAGSTGKNLPAIVMPHGGPSARDEWGFDWMVQFFASRGFAVLQPNYRGSSGYGSAWFQKNGFQSWQTAIGDVNDAGRWMIAQGITTPSKLAIVGWSYGGYAALQANVLDPDLFKAAVAIAPVTDLEQLRTESSRYGSYRLVDDFIGRGAHVKAGSPAQNVASFKAPVLMFHGNLDQNVSVAESRLMRDRLAGAGKSVEYVEFTGYDHYLEDGNLRAGMLSKIDAFIRKSLAL